MTRDPGAPSVRNPLLIALAVGTALLAAFAVAALTRVPYTVGDGDLAAVRLTWRMAGQAIEDCRTPSEEELAARPAHMRQTEVCESHVPPYRLRVQVDGETIEDILVLAGGAHEDNPIYVYSELRVAPGPHELSVVFAQEEQADGGAADSMPADRLELHDAIDLAPGQVALVTYDRETRTLVRR